MPVLFCEAEDWAPPTGGIRVTLLPPIGDCEDEFYCIFELVFVFVLLVRSYGDSLLPEWNE